jgi:hypothetical protein
MQRPDSIAVCPAKAQTETIFVLVDDVGENPGLFQLEAIKYGKTQFDQAPFWKTEFCSMNKGTDHADVAGLAINDLFTLAMPEAYFNIQRHAPALPGAVIHLSLGDVLAMHGIVATLQDMIQINAAYPVI